MLKNHISGKSKKGKKPRRANCEGRAEGTPCRGAQSPVDIGKGTGKWGQSYVKGGRWDKPEAQKLVRAVGKLAQAEGRGNRSVKRCARKKKEEEVRQSG